LELEEIIAGYYEGNNNILFLKGGIVGPSPHQASVMMALL
tara:strand:+ start:135 stop:254 length:120 start_codon:yes stop_codon:yes gene_type:complete